MSVRLNAFYLLPVQSGVANLKWNYIERLFPQQYSIVTNCLTLAEQLTLFFNCQIPKSFFRFWLKKTQRLAICSALSLPSANSFICLYFITTISIECTMTKFKNYFRVVCGLTILFQKWCLNQATKIIMVATLVCSYMLSLKRYCFKTCPSLEVTNYLRFQQKSISYPQDTVVDRKWASACVLFLYCIFPFKNVWTKLHALKNNTIFVTLEKL